MSTVSQSPLRAMFEHRDIVNMHVAERWVSAAAGAYLVVSAIRRGDRGGALRALFGTAFLRRAITGHCYTYQAFGINMAPRTGQTSVPYELGVIVHLTMTVARPRHEVYAFWRDFTALPSVMRHLISIEDLGSGRTRWTAEGFMGRPVSWEAELIGDVEDQRIAWRSLPGSQVDSAGSVWFFDAPDGGTRVRIELQYNPPAGFLGAYAAGLFGRDARDTIEADCRRVKERLEAGASATKEIR